MIIDTLDMVCHNIHMEASNENSPETILTRLKFKASDDLDELIKSFLKPNVREQLHQTRRRVDLYSQQHADLHIRGALHERDQDIIDNDRYEQMIGKTHRHEFHLQPQTLLRNFGKQGIELQFILSLIPNERRMIVEKPLFPPDYKDDIAIYTRLSRTRLMSEQAIHVAYKKMENEFNGNKELRGVNNAPVKLFVTDSDVYHRHPIPTIDTVSLHNKQAS